MEPHRISSQPRRTAATSRSSVNLLSDDKVVVEKVSGYRCPQTVVRADNVRTGTLDIACTVYPGWEIDVAPSPDQYAVDDLRTYCGPAGLDAWTACKTFTLSITARTAPGTGAELMLGREGSSPHVPGAYNTCVILHERDPSSGCRPLPWIMPAAIGSEPVVDTSRGRFLFGGICFDGQQGKFITRVDASVCSKAEAVPSPCDLAPSISEASNSSVATGMVCREVP